MPSSRGSSPPRDQTRGSYISCISRWVLYHYRHLGSPCPLRRKSIYGWCCQPNICVLPHIYVRDGNGTPLQSSCLENPMDGGARWAAVHGVAKSPTQLSDFSFTFHFHALEKELATHSRVLAWRIPGTGEPGGLPSMGSHRV